MDSNEKSYRRGQIFGFTVAEVLTLLLFILLLALAARILNVDKDKEEALDKADINRQIIDTYIKNLYSKIAPESEVKIIRESFRAAIEEEQKKLKQDKLRFKELERILLAAGDDFFDDAKTDKEKIEKMREALNLSGAMLDSGINKDTDENEFKKLAKLQDYLDNPDERDSVNGEYPLKLTKKVLNKELNECNLKKEMHEKNSNACSKRLGDYAGGIAAMQPCWRGKNDEPLPLYIVIIQNDGLVLKKAYNTLNDKPHADIIRKKEVYIDRVFADDLIDFNNAFKDISNNVTKNDPEYGCIFTINAQDRTGDGPGAKSRYKKILGGAYNIFERHSRLKIIWGFD